MRAILATVIVVLVLASSSLDGQSQPASASVDMRDLPTWVYRAEAALLRRLNTLEPLFELYGQQLGVGPKAIWVPAADLYVAGRVSWNPTPMLHPFGSRADARSDRDRPKPKPIPEGLVELIVPDTASLDPRRYKFKYLKTDFVSGVRTHVLDISPLREVSEAFVGRIWVEADGTFNIVRFTGINPRADRALSTVFGRKRSSYRVEGWRTHVGNQGWIPSFHYLEEVESHDGVPRVRAHVSLWAYERDLPQEPALLTRLVIEQAATRQPSESVGRPSPLRSQREWEQIAADNLIHRLTQAGVIARPLFNAEAVIEGVLNTLLQSSDVALATPMRVRILTTTPLEAAVVGSYLLLSRSIIDVLPDQNALALLLAHQIGHVVRGHQLVRSEFGYSDRLTALTDDAVLSRVSLRHTPEEEAEADEAALKLMKRSPFAKDLAATGLFLQTINELAPRLPSLVRPTVAEHLVDASQLLRFSEMLRVVPVPAADRLDQIDALPLGSRAEVDPWTGGIRLRQPEALAFIAPREKAPLMVTRLVPSDSFVIAVPTVANRR